LTFWNEVRSPRAGEWRWLLLTDVDTDVHSSERYVGAASCMMKALIHENAHLVGLLDPLLNWQPVQLITNIGSDAVELPLAQNDSCGRVEHILQRLDSGHDQHLHDR